MKIIVSGTSGFIGQALVSFFEKKGYEVIKLVRARTNLKSNEIAWDSERGVIEPNALEGADAVVHLAGENIFSGRWTAEKKAKIRDSRVVGTRLLSDALAKLKNKPKVFISASAIGYYGDSGDKVLTESSPRGDGFLALVCQQWEQASQSAKAAGIRVVNPRIGMVLDPSGGGLKTMLPLFKLGLGGRLGTGKQYMSWISLVDIINSIDFLIKQDSISGPVNLVSPYPVTNEQFTKTLGSVLNRFTIIPAPVAALRIAFGDQLVDEVLIASEKVQPKVLEDSGYRFSFPHLKEALESMLNS